MRVIVTRPLHEAAQWAGELRQRGFQAQALPLIRILAPESDEDVARAWRLLASARAAMFVSSNAVRHFFASPAAPGTWPDGVRAWATGPGTALALVAAGVAEPLIDAPPADAAQFDSETLWRQVAGQVAPRDQVLIVRGAEAGHPESRGRDWLEQQLGAAGAQVTTAVAYLRAVPQWSLAQFDEAARAASDAAWLFSSSQAVANLRDLLPGQAWNAACAIATHPRIERAARDAGFGVVCVSRPSVEAVVAALKSFG